MKVVSSRLLKATATSSTGSAISKLAPPLMVTGAYLSTLPWKSSSERCPGTLVMWRLWPAREAMSTTNSGLRLRSANRRLPWVVRTWSMRMCGAGALCLLAGCGSSNCWTLVTPVSLISMRAKGLLSRMSAIFSCWPMPS
ncbi:hypothetical protein D3C84_764740 [compost metagenome]